MIEVTFVDSDNQHHKASGEAGENLMEVAVNNMIPHILAECGGCVSCGTCRVDVRPQWLGVVGQASDAEQAMLEGLDNPQETSRLSCQVVLTEEMAGAEFTLSDEFC